MAIGPSGEFRDFDHEEVARLASDCQASVLLAKPGCGLWAYGISARWGSGGTTMEPSVLSVPFDREAESRRAGVRELVDTLSPGKDQRKALLLAAVKQRQQERSLFG